MSASNGKETVVEPIKLAPNEPSEIKYHDCVYNSRQLSKAERAGLEASIVRFGCVIPIVLWRHNKKDLLIEGRHRLELCRKHGIELRYRIFEGTEEQAVNLAYHLNEGRRHSTKGSRIMAAGKYARQLLENGFIVPDPMADLANQEKPKKPRKPKDPNAPKGEKKKRNRKSATKAVASLTGIPDRTVQRAAAVADKGSEILQEAVVDETVTVSDAAKILDEPKEVQNQAVDMVASGQAETLVKAVEQITESAAEAQVMVDDVGYVLPDRVKMAFSNREYVEKICRTLDRVIGDIREVVGTDGMRMQHTDSAIQQLQAVRANLWANRPTHVCPYCQGIGKCSSCKSEGWVTKTIFDTAPLEMREIMSGL